MVACLFPVDAEIPDLPLYSFISCVKINEQFPFSGNLVHSGLEFRENGLI